MQIEQIVQMESDKLELSGLFHERSQEPVKGLLLYLYTAVDIWMLLSPDDRRSVRNFNEFFEKERVVKLFLKELKSKKNKEKTAPAPHRKEKTIKEKSQKTRHSDAHAKQDLEERKRAFWNELLKYENKYGRQMLLKFYYYWAEELENLNMMKWEAEKARRSFDIKCRLGIWSKRSYETDDKAADIHFERVKGKKSAKAAVNTQEEQAIAAKRAEDNEKLEREIAERKQGAVSYEEYIRQKNEKKS